MNRCMTSAGSQSLEPAQELQAGQLWKLQRRYVYVVALRGSSIRFKFMDAPGALGERTLTSSVDTLWRYVLSRKGTLMRAVPTA